MQLSPVTERIPTPIGDPDLNMLLDRVKDEVKRELNCVQIGTIEEFNALKNTAKVSINLIKKLEDGRTFTYPPLSDCPVFSIQGGGAYLTFPVVKGDQCLVLFNDRDFDRWFLTGQTMVPNTRRAHSLSDGIVIVGLRNLTSPISWDSTKVTLDAGAFLLNIKNEVESLKAILDDFIQTVNDLVTTDSAVLSPTTKALLTGPVTGLKARVATLLGE